MIINWMALAPVVVLSRHVVCASAATVAAALQAAAAASAAAVVVTLLLKVVKAPEQNTDARARVSLRFSAGHVCASRGFGGKHVSLWRFLLASIRRRISQAKHAYFVDWLSAHQ